jgi:hypothetical protein
VFVHDPMYGDDELRHIGFEPLPQGAPLDAAVIQADHAEYSQYDAARFGNPRTILNGRNMPLSAVGPTIVRVGIA